MIPNLYIGNGCFTKHPLKTGCLGFQEHLHNWAPFSLPVLQYFVPTTQSTCLNFHDPKRLKTAALGISCESEPRKKPDPTFHYTGCLIGFFLRVYYNPHITGQYNPLYNPTNQGPFFRGSSETVKKKHMVFPLRGQPSPRYGLAHPSNCGKFSTRWMLQSCLKTRESIKFGVEDIMLCSRPYMGVEPKIGGKPPKSSHV